VDSVDCEKNSKTSYVRPALQDDTFDNRLPEPEGSTQDQDCIATKEDLQVTNINERSSTVNRPGKSSTL